MQTIKKEQLDFLNWEFGVFFHFGIRTFYEGHTDWDMQEMPLDQFMPEELNCEQWIQTAKAAGARYAILVCKHHDGFANWPSAYTEYSVKNTPWKGGNGDVVKDFIEACRNYDIKVGLYYSPAQFCSEQMESIQYDDYFVNQITELLSNYGKIDYLWFDGNGSQNYKYDTVRIIREIRRLQPEILIFNMWDPDTRWAGNESGMVVLPNNNVVNKNNYDFSAKTDGTDYLEERFLPTECDCRMRLENWFYSDDDINTVKSVDELLGLYYYSVGKGANLLLNIGPDRRGLLPEPDVSRLIEFGNQVKKMFQNSLAGNNETARTENTYTITLADHTLVNHAIMEEDMKSGGHIEAFSIYVYPYSYGERVLVYSGKTIGHKHICSFPTIRTKKIDIVIEEENSPHTIQSINLYYVPFSHAE